MISHTPLVTIKEPTKMFKKKKKKYDLKKTLNKKIEKII